MKYNSKNKPLICMQKNSTCYKGTKPMTVKGVLWHSTGADNPYISRYVQPYETDANYDEMIKLLGKNKYNNDWNHIKHNAGLNAWVGKLTDGSVATVQTMPWDYKPWGCGSGSKGSCNSSHCQFEICENSLDDKDYFNKVYKEACELTAYICDMYDLNPNGTTTVNGVKVPVILCHADAHDLGLGSNHGDVLYWFKKHGKTMNDVRKDVATLMKEATSAPSSASTELYRVRKSWKDFKSQIGAFKGLKNAKIACMKAGNGYCVFDYSGKIVYPEEKFSSYKVKIIADALNVRKGVGTGYKIVDTIKDKGMYTIVDEATDRNGNKWGLLKSYEKNRNGWISLKYTKRI